MEEEEGAKGDAKIAIYKKVKARHTHAKGQSIKTGLCGILDE